MSKMYYVYILASGVGGTLYIGVTSDLIKRMEQHRSGTFEGFTKKYDVHHLVYFESTEAVYGALEREKQLKKWNRDWKIRLIEEKNPEWRDLFDDIHSGTGSLRLRRTGMTDKVHETILGLPSITSICP